MTLWLSSIIKPKSPMPDYNLSAGNYPGMKYWTEADDGKCLVIRPGRVPWGAILFMEGFIGGLAFAILWPVWHYAPLDRSLFTMMCFPVGIAVLGCFLGPLGQIRTERAKGAILTYDRESEMIMLPRECLSLRKAQILEFRILQECSKPSTSERWTHSLLSRSKARLGDGARELQVVYRNPNVRSATVLRVSWSSLFADVVAALKAAGFAKIKLVEQQPGRSEWKESEI